MKKKKCWKLAIEVPNAWGGMPHLWMFLEKKYLPSYVPVGADGKPLDLEWVKEKQAKGEYASRWIYFRSGGSHISRQIGFFKSPKGSQERQGFYKQSKDLKAAVDAEIQRVNNIINK